TIPSANTPHFWHFSPYISESTYCKAKRGAILIAPDMQQKLLRLFEQNGADISIGFDEYVEQEGYEEVDTANCKKYNFCHLLAVMKQIFIIFVS
ncbi:hypothetical protein LEA_00364, partial [human gut metagenome]